jgi:hypothetical protein
MAMHIGQKPYAQAGFKPEIFLSVGQNGSFVLSTIRTHESTPKSTTCHLFIANPAGHKWATSLGRLAWPLKQISRWPILSNIIKIYDRAIACPCYKVGGVTQRPSPPSPGQKVAGSKYTLKYFFHSFVGNNALLLCAFEKMKKIVVNKSRFWRS